MYCRRPDSNSWRGVSTISSEPRKANGGKWIGGSVCGLGDRVAAGGEIVRARDFPFKGHSRRFSSISTVGADSADPAAVSNPPRQRWSMHDRTDLVRSSWAMTMEARTNWTSVVRRRHVEEGHPDAGPRRKALTLVGSETVGTTDAASAVGSSGCGADAQFVPAWEPKSANTNAPASTLSVVDCLESARASRLRDWQRRYVQWLRWSDTSAVVAVVALAQTLRFGSANSAGLLGFSAIGYTSVSALVVVIWVAALAIERTRQVRVIGSGLEEYRRIWTATLSVFGAIAVLSMILRLEVARGYLAIAFPLGVIALTGNRWMSRKYVARRRNAGEYMNSVLAVGRLASVSELAEALARHPGDGYRIVGVCAPGLLPRDSVSIPSVGSVPAFAQEGDIVSAVLESGADTVMLASGHLSPDEIRDLTWELEKIDVDLVVSPGVVDVADPRLTVRLVGGQSLIQIEKPQYDGAKCFQKRAFDVCFSLCVLALVAPIMLLAAIAVKVSSRGPVFYLSERTGLDGRPFQMIKFRSMVVDAERRLADVAHLNEGGGILFKIKSDPRVTSVGRVLRRFSIDELPQFINVLRRDMSVVGPRPPLPSEVESYNDRVRRRLLVRPGITGLWQVSGRSDLSWEDTVRLDLSYVENWSMLGDLVIAAKTLMVVVRGVGAY